MASQSILTGIRRLWEYMMVSSYGSIPLDIEEEHDPVREFLERQSRGDVQNEVVDGADVLPGEKPKSKPTGRSRPNTVGAGPPPEVTAVDLDTSLNEPESEAPLKMDDGPPVETESEMPQDVINSEEEEVEAVLPVTDTSREEGESEVSKMSTEEEHQEEEKIEGEQKEEGHKEEKQQGGGDDLLDIFRSEKEIKVKDIIQEILTDIDIHDLLEETRELMAEINTRRYGKH